MGRLRLFVEDFFLVGVYFMVWFCIVFSYKLDGDKWRRLQELLRKTRGFSRIFFFFLGNAGRAGRREKKIKIKIVAKKKEKIKAR